MRPLPTSAPARAPSLLLLLSLVTSLLSGSLEGCSKRPDPRDAIRDLIRRCEDAANAGRIDEISTYIAPGYRDNEGRDKDGATRFVERHMRRDTKRFAHARPLSITLDDDETGGGATLLVALAGVKLGPDDDLLQARADLIKLELTLRLTEDGWRIQAGKWSRPSPLDIL